MDYFWIMTAKNEPFNNLKGLMSPFQPLLKGQNYNVTGLCN